MRETLQQPGACLQLLHKAIAAGPPDSFAVLATTRAGHPRARSVVLRGMHEEIVWFSTHAFAAKVTDLAQCPVAQLCLWMPEIDVQLVCTVRGTVVGPVEALGSEAAAAFRRAAWEQHSKKARKMFFRRPPGTVFGGADAADDGGGANGGGGDGLAVPANFAVVQAEILGMDALWTAAENVRFTHEKVSGDWGTREIQP